MSNPGSYLSPAFEVRSEEEMDLLKAVDGRTGTRLYWLDFTRPLLTAFEAKNIVEVGPDTGDHSILLADYCNQMRGELTLIEPVVQDILLERIDPFSNIRLIRSKSYEHLDHIDMDIDAFILDGDINYYSMKADLEKIRLQVQNRNSRFPLIFFRSASWPYACRDMYYAPEVIPENSKKPSEKSGMTPWSSSLVPMGFNFPFENACEEGGDKNGVMPAIRDFIESGREKLSHFCLPFHHGFGVIYDTAAPISQYIERNLSVCPQMQKFLETVEIARINEALRQIQERRRFREIINHLQQPAWKRLIQKIINRK